MATIQVLAGLMTDPMLVLNDHYTLSPDDFPERFHRIVFGAIDQLVRKGAKEISGTVIEEFLTDFPAQERIFEDNNGVEYVEKAQEIYESSNFQFYYDSLKKCSLLNQLEAKGFNIQSYYDPTEVDPIKQEAIQTRFKQATIDEIVAAYEVALSEVKANFGATSGRVSQEAGKNMMALKEQLKEIPEMGFPMNSKKLTTICRGRRLKKLYMRTLPTGLGKTRISIADACLVSIPKYYDLERKEWVSTNCQEPTLYITTELEIQEVQTMIMAYVSGVAEEKILDGRYSEDEESRVNKAIKIIANSPLWVEQIPQFDIDDIETVIKEYKLKHCVSIVFFDYIFTSTKMLMEIAKKTRGVNLREDNVLMLFADRMKALCNSLNVHIDTSTQANGDWKNVKDADQNLIRGSKAMGDKIDIGYVGLEPTAKDLESIRSIMATNGKAFFKQPNLVLHIYKVRRGKINHVKLFEYFDYSTLRTTDLFVTDRDYHLIDVENTSVEVILDQTTEEEKSQSEFHY